jgi:hypothetical protein
VDLPAQLAGLLVAVSVTALVVVRAATAPSPQPLRAATPAERMMFAASVASKEDEWRGKAADDFPSDHWSQRDAFHGHEAAAVRDIATSNGVPYEDVLRAIDEDVHHDRRPGRNRCAAAVPVHPRPIFD